MVLCSDGVWEFISNEEVMEIGNKYFYQNDINEFCTQLLKRSTEIWENEENYMEKAFNEPKLPKVKDYQNIIKFVNKALDKKIKEEKEEEKEEEIVESFDKKSK